MNTRQSTICELCGHRRPRHVTHTCSKCLIKRCATCYRVIYIQRGNCGQLQCGQCHIWRVAYNMLKDFATLIFKQFGNQQATNSDSDMLGWYCITVRPRLEILAITGTCRRRRPGTYRRRCSRFFSSNTIMTPVMHRFLGDRAWAVKALKRKFCVVYVLRWSALMITSTTGCRQFSSQRMSASVFTW